MGTYVINCPECKKPHLWWSGNMPDQRCSKCFDKSGDKPKWDNESFTITGSLATSSNEIIDLKELLIDGKSEEGEGNKRTIT